MLNFGRVRGFLQCFFQTNSSSFSTWGAFLLALGSKCCEIVKLLTRLIYIIYTHVYQYMNIHICHARFYVVIYRSVNIYMYLYLYIYIYACIPISYICSHPPSQAVLRKPWSLDSQDSKTHREPFQDSLFQQGQFIDSWNDGSKIEQNSPTNGSDFCNEVVGLHFCLVPLGLKNPVKISVVHL